MRLGINVGETSTHAVLMQSSKILSEVDTSTTLEIEAGIVEGLRILMSRGNITAPQIDAVTIGAAHFAKMIHERSQLTPVAVVRLGLPATDSLPPFIDWPQDLREAIKGQAFLAHGGFEFDGRPISRLDPQEIGEIARKIRDAGFHSIAISSVFSIVNASMEEDAADLIRKIIPEATITLSNEIGRMGLLERENAAILNACLCDFSRDMIQTFRQALAKLQIDASLYLSQNDGTAMAADFAERYPALTFASTSSNAMRGAAFLSGTREAVVVDIGGKETKVSVLVRGFPREATSVVRFGGVRVNLRIPELCSFNLGLGSLVSLDPLRIGPNSVGRELKTRSLIYGGTELTAADIAVAAGLTDWGQRAAVSKLPIRKVVAVVSEIQKMVENAVEQMKACAEPVMVVLVGSGSVLVRNRLTGATEVIRPDYFSIAKAVGAAISQVGGEADLIFSLSMIGREAALQQARDKACARALSAGADPDTIQVVDEQVTPLNYLRGNVVRIRVRSTGDLAVHS